MPVRPALVVGGLALAATAVLPLGLPHPGAAPAPQVAVAGTAAPPDAMPAVRPAAVVRYVMPVDGSVARLFDPPAARWSAGHRGVDLLAAPGDPVRSPADGVVEFSGVVVDRTVLTVRHPDGLRSSLEPLVEPLARGTPVRTGQVVATLAGPPGPDGHPGHCAPATCLHWGVRRGDEYVDPLGLLRPGPVVLLPGP